MIATRHVRASALTTSAFLWEGIDTTAREYVMTPVPVLEAGHGSRSSTFGLWARRPHEPAQLCTAHVQAPSSSMLPAICRNLSSSPQQDLSSQEAQTEASGDPLGQSGGASQQSMETDEDSMKRMLLDKALSHVVSSVIAFLWHIHTIVVTAFTFPLDRPQNLVCSGNPAA